MGAGKPVTAWAVKKWPKGIPAVKVSMPRGASKEAHHNLGGSMARCEPMGTSA